MNILSVILMFGAGWMLANYISKKKDYKGCSGDCQQGRKDCNCH